MALTKLTTDLIDSTIVTSVNGSTGAVTLETGTDWQATPKTAAFTATAGEGYFVNTTSAAITVTLPSSPSSGDEVNLVDYAGTAATNNITITSSNNINGASNDVFIDYERGGVSIVYVDATQGWIAYNAANETAEALIPVPLSVAVDYLVIAGGGAGGGGQYNGGGGGAGGYLTNYGGTALNLAFSTNYLVTIGAGGTGGTTTGVNGNNSVFNNITSIGGGGGQHNAPRDGSDGGSGGGGSQGPSVGGDGTNIANGDATNQGNNGGGGWYAAGAGGGGAGAAGLTGTNTSPYDGGVAGVSGGIGLQNAITIASGITAPYYAGGGGGGGRQVYSVPQGIGGLGGGGNGGPSTGGNGAAATPNTGGGGGGVGSNADNSTIRTSGNGGSGIVILRYPDSYDITVGSGLITGTLNTAVGSGEKYTTFTGGTGNISFS